MYHTLGQRKGLGIGGTKDGTEEPWYVVDKDVENNILIVAQGHEHPRLMSVGLIAQQLHWVDREPFTGTGRPAPPAPGRQDGQRAKWRAFPREGKGWLKA